MRLIDANKLVKWLIRAGRYLKGIENSKPITRAIGKIIDHVKEMPAVDAVEVLHGRWLHREDNGTPMHECSECGARVVKGLYEYENPNRYCYRCGAKMDGGSHETD